jgi:hypothetical protein
MKHTNQTFIPGGSTLRALSVARLLPRSSFDRAPLSLGSAWGSATQLRPW